ncbi:phosphoenolpyruvate--protein phosphotransferase [Actinomadura sp. 7K534]|uniref:phosphoenolpyruvate--protein phosphotransferase n=1 Tax=Actinomadura sp. 7K534 TaxID=2530366 RepID=UPI001047D996|nr:phosphoenolpyruvate--protein phosphotransferase [Actinomadura sp. 7K534]TDB96277.1 phosphoenolpyruvate--protein phosphotransferase [Actinomadura sp. 7K534]
MSEAAPSEAAPSAAAAPRRPAAELRGLGVSPGTAAGPAEVMGPAPELPPPRAVTDPEAETGRAVRALAAVEAELDRRAAAAPTPEAREILAAQSAMAADPMLAAGVRSRVERGADAAHALHGAFAEAAQALLAAGGHFAERAADLADLSGRAVAAVLGRPVPGVPSPGHPFVLVADDLSPADTAALDTGAVLALVTERGGPTGHTAILARSLGLPAVVGCAGILGAAVPGEPVSVDGTTGTVRTGVTEREAAGINARGAAAAREAAVPAGPGRTADGRPVDLMVNIGSAADLGGVDLTGVAGVGLFRTEFLFLGRREEPGPDEQAAAYAEVFAAAGDRTVVVRTLDAGADKPLPFLRMPEEPNPALGVRGLRVARRRPDVLTTQLEAIARAAAGTRARVAVMAPMVSTPAEADEFVALARDRGLPVAGVMIEVPSAALRAARILREADFLSIGTNDLSQYTLAADRQSSDVPELLDPWQPAVLDLVARCAEAGGAAGKSVGVCGEAAADPLLAPVLAGLGVTRLSMAPRALPTVRAALLRRTFGECADLAERALAADGPAEARGLALAHHNGGG